MKSHHILLFIILLIGIILISGCTEESTPATGTDTKTTPATTDSSSGCKSPYDGTWKGLIQDSGDLSVTRYDKDGAPVYTENPFIAQYDFEITLQCGGINYDQTSGAVDSYWFNITHLKASHPLFDCANGCVPQYSNTYIEKDGTAYMGQTLFPNGAIIYFPDMHASPDGKTINIFITGKYFAETIGSGGDQKDSQGYYYFVETYNCQQYGGKGSCMVKTILPNTIILTKVS